MANVVPFTARRPGSDPADRCHRWSRHQRVLLLRRLVGGGKNRRRSPQSIAQPRSCIFRRRADCYRDLPAAQLSLSSPLSPCSRSSPIPPLSRCSARRSSVRWEHASRRCALCSACSAAHGAQHGRSARDLCARPRRSRHITRRALLPHSRACIRALVHPANAVLLQTGMALARPDAWRLRPHPRLHHFFRRRLSRAHRSNAVPHHHARARWWYPLAPIVFIAGSGILAIMLLMHNPGSALLGAAVVLLGLPVRWLLTRRGELASLCSNRFRSHRDSAADHCPPKTINETN